MILLLNSPTPLKKKRACFVQIFLCKDGDGRKYSIIIIKKKKKNLSYLIDYLIEIKNALCIFILVLVLVFILVLVLLFILVLVLFFILVLVLVLETYMFILV